MIRYAIYDTRSECFATLGTYSQYEDATWVISGSGSRYIVIPIEIPEEDEDEN